MKSFLIFLVGVIVTFVTMSLVTVNQYGRMANHKHCNMSLESLGGLAASNYVYYTYHHNTN